MQHTRGFTLVEISIVIVIISLLAAGVVVGKTMVASATLRAITTEHEIYKTAFKEFIDKYQAIPGDMNNATGIWGTDAVCPTVVTNTVPKVATCNGDGNGVIGTWTNGTAGATEPEWFRAWQHLSNAGLIEGKFTGARGANASTETSIGVNVPTSKSGNGGWTLMWMNSVTDNNFFFSTTPVASHVLIVGAQTASSFTDAALLSTSNAKNIDRKFDDGLPFTGDIRAKRSAALTCGVSSATTSDYGVDSATQVCQLMFIMGM